MSTLRVAALSAYRNLTMTVPFLRQTGQISKVGVITPEILPALPFVLASIYQIGGRQSRYESTFPLKEGVSVLEAKLQEGLIKKASDLFVYLPLGVGAYEMGRSENGREALYHGLKTALMFTAGYMGITNIGPGITYYLQSLETERLYHLMNNREVISFIKNKPETGLSVLNATIDNLKRSAERRIGMFKRVAEGKNISPTVVSDSNQAFAKLQTEFLTQFEKAQINKLPSQTLKAISLLKEGIQSYQAPYIKFFRSFNPLMGYFLATTLVALPLTKLIRRFLVPQGVSNPEKEKDMVHPLWLDSVWQIFKGIWP